MKVFIERQDWWYRSSTLDEDLTILGQRRFPSARGVEGANGEQVPRPRVHLARLALLRVRSFAEGPSSSLGLAGQLARQDGCGCGVRLEAERRGCYPGQQQDGRSRKWDLRD